MSISSSISPVEHIFISPLSGLKLAAQIWGSKESVQNIISTANEPRVSAPIHSFTSSPVGATGKRKEIIALHGWMDNSGTWNLCLPMLVEAGYVIVALDFPGHGLSEHRPQGTIYLTSEYPLEIMAIANLIRWKSFHLLGHSLGGIVSTFVASAFPGNVCSVALVEAIGPMAAAPSTLPSLMKNSFEFLYLFEERKKREEVSNTPRRLYNNVEHALKVYVETIAVSGSSISESGAREIVNRGTKTINEQGVMFTHDPRLRAASFFRYSEDQIQEILKAMECPTLVVIADKGSEFVKKGFLLRKNQIRKCSELYITGAGHHPQLDAPEEVAKGLLKFLDAHSSFNL